MNDTGTKRIKIIRRSKHQCEIIKHQASNLILTESRYSRDDYACYPLIRACDSER